MTSYKVLSDRLVVAKQGQIIDEALLDGANIQALIDGEHIAVVTNKKSEDNTETKEK
jgi:hypothetical protein